MAKGYWILWAATLLFFAAVYTLLIPIPLYLEALQLPDWQIALILGAFGIAALGFRPLSGAAAQAWGYKKVLTIATASMLVGAAGMSLAAHPLALFGLRLLQALGYVAFTTAAIAQVSDLTPQHQRGKALAWFGTAANLAMTTVPAAVHASLAAVSIQGTFWLAGGLALVAGILALCLRFDPGQRQKTWPRLYRIFSIPRQLGLPVLLAALFGIGFGIFIQFLPLLAERRGIAQIGLLYTTYGVSIIICRLVLGPLLDRCNHRTLLALGFAALGTGLVVFAFSFSLLGLLCAALCLALAGSILHPLLIVIHIGHLAKTQAARGSAIFYLGFDAGIGLGAWLAAPLLASFGLAGAYLMSASAALLALLLIKRMGNGHPAA